MYAMSTFEDLRSTLFQALLDYRIALATKEEERTNELPSKGKQRSTDDDDILQREYQIHLAAVDRCLQSVDVMVEAVLNPSEMKAVKKPPEETGVTYVEDEPIFVAGRLIEPITPFSPGPSTREGPIQDRSLESMVFANENDFSPKKTSSTSDSVSPVNCGTGFNPVSKTRDLTLVESFPDSSAASPTSARSRNDQTTGSVGTGLVGRSKEWLRQFGGGKSPTNATQSNGSHISHQSSNKVRNSKTSVTSPQHTSRPRRQPQPGYFSTDMPNLHSNTSPTNIPPNTQSPGNGRGVVTEDEWKCTVPPEKKSSFGEKQSTQKLKQRHSSTYSNGTSNILNQFPSDPAPPSPVSNDMSKHTPAPQRFSPSARSHSSPNSEQTLSLTHESSILLYYPTADQSSQDTPFSKPLFDDFLLAKQLQEEEERKSKLIQQDFLLAERLEKQFLAQRKPRGLVGMTARESGNDHGSELLQRKLKGTYSKSPGNIPSSSLSILSGPHPEQPQQYTHQHLQQYQHLPVESRVEKYEQGIQEIGPGSHFRDDQDYQKILYQLEQDRTLAQRITAEQDGSFEDPAIPPNSRNAGNRYSILAGSEDAVDVVSIPRNTGEHTQAENHNGNAIVRSVTDLPKNPQQYARNLREQEKQSVWKEQEMKRQPRERFDEFKLCEENEEIRKEAQRRAAEIDNAKRERKVKNRRKADDRKKKEVAEDRTRAIKQGQAICEACQNVFEKAEMITLLCKHTYCQTCIKQSFENALRDKMPFVCCEPVSIKSAGNLFDLPFIRSYNEFELEVSTPNPLYCAVQGCSKFIPPASIHGDVGICQKCSARTCRHCAMRHDGVCPKDKEAARVKELAKQKR